MVASVLAHEDFPAKHAAPIEYFNRLLANHPWLNDPNAVLPAEVDTVVIGAGFTGGALAYHWAKRASADRRLIVLEMDDPASGSSGRNEGLVVMGRYFKMVCDSVYKHLSLVRTDLSRTHRAQLASQFADRYCCAAYRNATLIEQTIRDGDTARRAEQLGRVS